MRPLPGQESREIISDQLGYDWISSSERRAARYAQRGAYLGMVTGLQASPWWRRAVRDAAVQAAAFSKLDPRAGR